MHGSVGYKKHPSLAATLDSAVIASDTVVTLTITDAHTGSVVLPSLWHSLPITGTGGGFKRMGSVGLLVGGRRAYLPLVTRE